MRLLSGTTHAALRTLAMIVALALAGCATVAPGGPDAVPPGTRSGRRKRRRCRATPSRRRPTVNLSGFPLPYRQGYADGCASATGAERKDSTRFAADGNYRTGWQDGLALCRRK